MTRPEVFVLPLMGLGLGASPNGYVLKIGVTTGTVPVALLSGFSLSAAPALSLPPLPHIKKIIFMGGGGCGGGGGGGILF